MAKTNTSTLLLIGGISIAAVAAYMLADDSGGGGEAESVTEDLGKYTLEVIRKNGEVAWFAKQGEQIVAGGSGESSVVAMENAKTWAKENE